MPEVGEAAAAAAAASFAAGDDAADVDAAAGDRPTPAELGLGAGVRSGSLLTVCLAASCTYANGVQGIREECGRESGKERWEGGVNLVYEHNSGSHQ